MATLPLTLDTLQTSGDNETPPLMSPQILKTVVGNDSSLTTSIANEMEGTPERPTNLTLESTTTTTSTQQQQQQHSNLTPSSATTTIIHGNISPALSSAGSLSPSFLPEMPQWKRDLIQRRKQNVQRTISASSPTSSSTSSIVAASSATILSSSPTSAATLLAAGGSLKTSTSSSSVRSLAGSNTNIDQLASDGFLPQNCSTKDFTKTKLKPASSSSSLTTTTSSLLSSPLKEKSEKLFGGQYTATATSTLFTHTTKEEEITNTHLNLNKSKELNKEEHETKENQQQQSQEEEELLLNDETQLAIITSKQQQQQQQQQLHMATRLTGSIHNINTTTASSSSSSSTCSNISSISGTTVNVKRTEREDSNNITGALACVNNKQQNVKQSLNKCESERLLGAANNLLNITGNNIINNKTIGVISNNSVNNISNNSAASSNNNNNNNSVLINNKISQKLQENQFIKNEQQQQQQINNKKFIKFNKQNTITGDLKSPTKINKSSLVSSNSAHSLLQTTNYCATSSTSSSTAGFLTGKKKMVAVQDIKKSSQTKPNHLNNINSNCQAANRLNNRNNMVSSAAAAGGNGVVGVVGVGGGGLSGESSGNDLDNPEDLSYGPGIVSKLRCRYLSLALRESMEQQRLNKDQLRRSTSLNNLLDNCDEDEEEEEEEEEEVDQEELKEINAENQENIQNNLIHKKMGILKSSKGQQQQQQQKRFSSSAATQQGSHGVGVTFTETSYHQRSRHLKRGNDSLKRARSVEALLSEKSPWHGKNNYTNSSQTVSIEDKIHNARERLQQGIEHLPPKRLTSIIDDTERPPPDLVKQTLKMFEASANRRPKTQNLNNAKGEVASKVETFKNIIKEQKPTITYPKPLSPSKKLNSPLITQQKSLKSPLQAQDLMQTPLGRKTSKVVNNEAASTPLKSNNLSEHTPDIIPRQKFNSSSSQERDFKQNKEFLQQNTNTNKRDLLNKEKYEIDSPVTALSKELSKMKINETTPMKIIKKDNDLKQQKHNQSDSNNKIEEVNRDLEGGVNVEVNVNEEGDACQQYNNEQQQTQININSSLLNENDKIANKNQPQQNENTEAIALKATTAATVTVTEEINIQKTTTKNEKLHEVKFNNYDSLTKATSITSTSTPPPPTKTSNALSDEDDENDHQEGEEESTKRITRSALDNIAKAGYTQQFKFNNSTINNSNNTSNLSPLNSGKQIGVIKPLLQQQPTPISQQQQQQKENSLNMDSLKHSSPSSLTSREIEKNRINDLKKSSSQNSSLSTPPPSSNTSSASLTHTSTPNTIATAVAGASAGYSDVDSVISATNSPLWAMRKRRQAPPAAPAENTSMVFNFSNRKEVPDYIENDGVIFRRKRELPKPNESGFVLLGDLSVETSTDMDYDDFSMCPPSPCDVEFVNANIVIDGKSSIRQKSKDTTFRVQFNDTLTSTFEYPSEASLIMDDSFSAYNEGYTQPHGSCSTADDFTQAFQNLCLEQSAINQHHHVADEIIQLPPTLNNSSTPANASNNTPSKNILGNLPLDYPDLQKGIPLTTAQQLTTPTMATLDLKVTDNEPTILEEQKKSRKDLNLPLKQQQQQQKPPLPVKRFLMKNSPVVAATVATPKISYIKNSNVNLKNYAKKPQQNHEIINTKEIPQVFPTKGEENVMIPKMKGDLPKVLNNPQYACFLMDTTTTTTTTASAIKSPIQRSRSNEFQKKFSTFSLNANVVSRSNSLRNLEAPKQFSLTTTTATLNAAGSTTNYFNQEVNLENIFNSILKPHLAKVEKSLDSGKDKAFLKPGNCIKNTERCKSLNNLQEYKENPLNIKETLKHSQDNLNLKNNSQEFNKSKEIFKNLELKSLENINSPRKLLKNSPNIKAKGIPIPETYLNLEIPLKIASLESSKNAVIRENPTVNITTNLVALPLKSSLKSENLFENSKDFVKIQEKSWEIKQNIKENNNYVHEESPNPNKNNKNSLNLKSNFNNKSMTSDGDIKNLASFTNKANVMETNLVALSLETFDRQEDFSTKSKDLLNKSFLNLEANSNFKSITSKGALKCPTSLEHKAIVMELNLAALALKTFDSQEDLLNSNFNNKSISSTENLKNMASLETNANGLDLTALSSDCLNKSEYMKKLSEKFPNSQNLSKSLMNVKEMSQNIDTNTQNSSNINSLEFPITRKSYEKFNSKATLGNEVNVMESNLAALSMESSNKLKDMPDKLPAKAEATPENELNVMESNLAALSGESLNKLENMSYKSLAKVKNFQKEAVTILKEREITQNSCEAPQNSSNLKSLEFPMTINSYENLISKATLENEVNVIKTNLSALSIKTSNTLEDIPDKSSAKAENSPRERGIILKNRELSQNSYKIIQNSLNSESLELSISLNCCENVNTMVTLGNSESNLTALSSNKPENPLDTQIKSKELKEFVTKSNEIVFKAKEQSVGDFILPKTKENSLEFPENSLEFPENSLDSSDKKQNSLNCNKKLNLQQSLSNCGKLYNKETLDIKGNYVDNNLAALSLKNEETLRKSEELNNDLKHFENLSNFKEELKEIVKDSKDKKETPEVLLKTQGNSLKLMKFSLNSPRKNHCNLNANKSLELPKFLNTSDKLKRVASFDYETYNPESNLAALSLGALNNLENLPDFQQKSKETTKQMENSQTLDSLNENNTPWELKNSLENNQSYGNPPKPLKRLSLTLNKTYLTDYKSHITQNLPPREIKSWENLSLNNKDPKANLLDSKANSQESLSLSVNAENLQEYSFKIKDNLINKRLKYQSKSQDDLQEDQTLSLSFKHKTISNENIRDFNEYSLYRNITTTNKSSLKLINSPKSNKKSRENFSKSINTKSFLKRRSKSVDNIDMNVNNVNLTFIHSKSVNNLDSPYKTKTLSHFLSKSMDNINSITNSNITDEFKEFLNENYFNFKLKNSSTENLSNIELINPKTPLKDLNKSLLMSLDSLDAYEDAQDYMTLENDNEDLLTSEILEDINIGLNTSSQYDFHNLLTLKKSKTSYCLQNLNKSYSLESESNSEDNFASACNTLESKWSVKPADKPPSNTASIPNAPNQKIPSKKPKTFRVKTTEKLFTLTQMASHNVNSYATFRKSKNLYKNASKTFKNSMKFYENFSEKSLEKIMKPKSSMKRSISLTENVVKTAEINRKIFAKSEKLMRKVRQINEEESPTENSNSFEYFEAGEEGLRKEEYQEEENKIEEELQENSKKIQETFINKQSPDFLDKIKPLATLTSEKMAALSLEENYPNFLFEKENLTNFNEINIKEIEIQRNLAALALEFPNKQENQTNLIDCNQENNKQTKIKRNLAALALEFPKKQETRINFLFEAKKLPDSNQETNKQTKIKRNLAALALKFPNKQENHQDFSFKTKNLPDSDTTNNKQTKIKRNLAALALDSLNKAEIYSDFSIKTESLQDSNKKNNNLINFSGNLAALSLEFPNKQENQQDFLFKTENLQDFKKANNQQHNIPRNLAALYSKSLNTQENRTNFLFKTKNLPDFKQKNNEQTKIKRNLAALSLEFPNKQENQQDFLFKIKKLPDFNKTNNKEIYIKRNLAALSLESLNERFYPDFLIKTEIMPDSNNRNGEQIKIANNLAALSLDSLNQQKTCHTFLDKRLNLPNFFNNKDKPQENLNKNSFDLEISETQNSPNKLKRMASLQHEIVDIDINLAAQQENRRETMEKTDKLFETKKNSNNSLKSNGNSLKNIKEINGNSAKNFDDLKKVQEVLNTKGNFILKDNSEAKEYLSKTRFHSKEISFNSYYPKDNLNFCQVPRSPEIISSETSNKSNKSLEQLCVKEKSTNLNFNSGPRPFKRLYESNTKKEEQEIGIKTKKAPEDAALKSLKAKDSKLFSDLTSLESQCFIENKSNNFKENLNSTASCQNSKTSSTSHPRFSSNKVKFNVYSSTPTRSLKTKTSLENSLETKECLSLATDFTPLVVTSLTISTLSKPLEEKCILANSFKGINSFTSSNDFKQKFPENSLKSSHNFQSVEYIPQMLKNISNTNNCEESFGESGKLPENFSKSPKNFSKSLGNSLECGENSLKIFKNSQTFENSLNIKELSGNQENKKDSLSIPLRSSKDFQNLSQFPGNSLKPSNNFPTPGNSSNISELSKNEGIRRVSVSIPLGPSKDSQNSSKLPGNSSKFSKNSLTSSKNASTPGNILNKNYYIPIPLGPTKDSQNSSKFSENSLKFPKNFLSSSDNSSTTGSSSSFSELPRNEGIRSVPLSIPLGPTTDSQSSSKFPENSLNFHKNSLNSSNNASTPGNSLNFTELSPNERIEKDSLPILLRSTKDTQNSSKLPENSSIIPQYSLEYPNDSQTSKNFANFTEIPKITKDLHKISYNTTNSFVNPAKYPGDSFRSSQTAPTCKSSSNYPGNAQTVTTYKNATKIPVGLIKTANSAELFEKSSKFPGNSLKSRKDYQTSENLLKSAGNSLKFRDNFPTLGNSLNFSGTSFCNSDSKDHNQISLRLSKTCDNHLKVHENSSKFFEDSLKSLEDYSISLDSPQTAKNASNVPKAFKINLISKDSLVTFDKSNYSSNAPTKVEHFSGKSCHKKLVEDTKYKITDTNQLETSSFVCRNFKNSSYNFIPNEAILCFENSPYGRTMSDNLSENSKKIGDKNSQISENNGKSSENSNYFHKNSVPVQSQGLKILNSNQNSLSKVESFVKNSDYSQGNYSSKEDLLALVPNILNLDQNLSPKVETFVRNSDASQISFNLIKYSSNSVKIADNSPTNNNSNNYEKTVAKSPNSCQINENSINYQRNSSSKSNTPESNTPEMCRIVENSSAKVETFVRNSNGCQFSFNLIKYSQNSPKIPDNSPVKHGPSKFQEKSPKSADINQISQNPYAFKGTALKSSNNSQISKSSYNKEENSPKYPDNSEIYNGSYNKIDNFPKSLDNFQISQNLTTFKGTDLKSSNNSQFSESSYMKNEISPNNLEICNSFQQFCGNFASLNSFNLNRDSQNSSKISHNSPATEIPNNFKGNSLKFPDNSQFTKNAKIFLENNSIKEDSLSSNFWENSPKFPEIIPQDNLNPSSITSDDCNKFPGNAINQIETKKCFANTSLIGNCNTTPLEEFKCVTRSSSTLITRNNFNSASSQLLTATHLKLNPNINKLNDHNFNKTPIPQPTTTTTTTTNNKLTTTPTTTTTTTPTTILATTIPTLTVKDFEQNIAKDFNNITTTTLISTFTTNFPTKVVALTNTKETTTTKSINISSSCSSFSSSPIPNKTWATTAKYQQQNQQQQFEKVITTTTKSPPLTTSTTITTSTLSTTKINPPHVLPRRVFNNNLKTTRATTTTMTCNTSSIKSSTATSSSSSSTCSSSTTCISSVNNINNNAPPPLPPLRRRIPGSAPLGFYTPLKAPIDRLFQLGVTRAPSLMSNIESPTTETTATTTTSNGGSRLYNGISSLGNHNDDDNGEGGNGSIVGISGGLIQDDYDDVSNKKRILKAANNLEEEEEPESLQYIKPAEDDLNMAYSEGTQKTDLLY